MGSIKNYNSIISRKNSVKKELDELKNILNSDNFSVDSDLWFFNNKKEKNTETMIDLNFDTDDIINELITLEINNYSHTLLDEKDNEPPWLYVFGKNIQGKEIYIKFKVRKNENKCVVCVSFHYAERKLDYPYK